MHEISTKLLLDFCLLLNDLTNYLIKIWGFITITGSLWSA